MEFWLQKSDSDKFQLPVKPSDYEIFVSSKNTVVNVIKLGDVNLIGNTGLREISLSSFFPAQDYNFSYNSDRKKPIKYVNKLEKWRKSGKPIRVIITDTLNMECTIESFYWGEQDATGDIYYTLSLKEYVKPKTSKIKTSSSSSKSSTTTKKDTSTRTTKSTSSSSNTTHKVKSGDSLWSIAKKYYGDGSKYNKIYNANKKLISDPSVLTVGITLTIP